MNAGTPSFRRTVATAMVVAAAYYVGAHLGLALTFPPATTSVLWPPNAILTAALLMSPPKTWWVCLAAALPVHIWLEIGAGFSPVLVALLFLTNCTEALIAAIGVRALSDAPTRFDSFRRVAAFIGAAGLLAPIVSSFADATVVNQLRGEPYWDVWRVRVFANVLTELSVAPIVILGWRAAQRLVGRPPSGRRVAEGIALGAALIAVALLVFGRPSVRDAAVPGAPPTPIVLLLPVFGWAAMRFGVGGISAALLGSAIIASYETASGLRPFATLAPLDSLIAVQMILAVVAMPLMCLAGLLAERRQATTDLAARLHLEKLLSSISTSFVKLPDEAMAVDTCLARTGEFLGVDHTVLLRVDETFGDLELERQWCAPGRTPLTTAHYSDRFPGALSRLLNGETLVWTRRDALRPDAGQDGQASADLDLRSLVVLPCVLGSSVRGALAAATARERSFSEADIMHLRLVADVLANALARREAEMDAQRSRQELAHVARRASMGELAASLAHQLNQPLTGILSNAQAARRVLESDAPALSDIHASLGDIVDDCNRARDDIQRVRDMLAPSGARPIPLNTEALVREVAMLLASDTLIRRVSLSLEFGAESPWVEGDRVLLQQAILHVLLNAIDAVAHLPLRDRLVSVRTTSADRGSVQIQIRDHGAGLPPGAEQQVFEPFFSTKKTGMGMGLAISRSIVENHGGSIEAANQPTGGVVVTITLPAFAELMA